MSARRIVIADYGLGNIFNIVKAFAAVGAEPLVSDDPAAVSAASGLVIPGVGAFGDGMAGLARRRLVEPIRGLVASGRPVLGVCLGMQLLFEESEEFGRHEGLGLLPGRVVSLGGREGFSGKLPHVGWNALRPSREWRGTVLEGLAPGAEVYFVHSFVAAPRDRAVELAASEHGGASFCAAVQRDRIAGCQFHPEKSREAGLGILRSFARSCGDP